MKGVTLKQLRYFEALAEHRHFGRASAACSVSQPALSVQIKELEAELGAVLFERGPRQVRLTALGEDMLQRVRGILERVDELGDVVRASRDGLGRLRLGVIPTIAPYLLPGIIESLYRTYNGLDLHVRETVTPRLISELSDGRLDAAIVALPVSESSFEETALFEEPFVLVRHKSEKGRPVPDVDGLRALRLLLLEEGHCFRDQALAFCNIDRALPRDGLDGSSLTTLVQMVGAGIGVTLIPDMAVPIETRSADVAVSNFDAPVPTRTVGMIWRRTSPLASQLEKVADVVREAAGRGGQAQ